MAAFEYRMKKGDALYNDLMELTGEDLHLFATSGKKFAASMVSGGRVTTTPKAKGSQKRRFTLI